METFFYVERREILGGSPVYRVYNNSLDIIAFGNHTGESKGELALTPYWSGDSIKKIINSIEIRFHPNISSWEIHI